MPIYEFQCPKCNCTEEIFLKSISDYITIICKDCNIEMKKIISKSDFHLRGAGWSRRKKPTIEKG